MKRTIALTSPHESGQDVRDAQYLLSGHNRFRHRPFPVRTYHGVIDGDWGEASGHAADRARYWLGYPKSKVHTGEFGPMIRSFLLPRSAKDAKLLPAAFRLRRKARLAREARRLKRLPNSRKSHALAFALSQAGYKETPVNHTKFGRWYGFDGVAWCAIFVSWALNQAGIKLKTALAFQWEYWGRARQNGLSITANPEPGDIVVYHHGQGHTGLFRRWTNRAAGEFEAVEGNTSGPAGSQDNGGEVRVQSRSTHWVPTVFVRVP